MDVGALCPSRDLCDTGVRANSLSEEVCRSLSDDARLHLAVSSDINRPGICATLT